MDITTFRLAFAVLTSAKPVSQTFTSNGTITFPAGVTVVDMSGYGAKGTAAQPGSAYQYENKTIYGTRRSTGATEVVYTDRYIVNYTGQTAYCGPVYSTPSDPTYSSNQTCYTYDGYSETPPQPATTGASATGLGKTFPGSTGNTQQATTVFTGVPVTAGTTYNIVVPAGGSITINYYA